LDWSLLSQGYSYPAKNLIRYVVTPENPRTVVGDFPASLKYYGLGSWPCGRVSVRGNHSILQGFQRVGSNFLPLGTPTLLRISEPVLPAAEEVAQAQEGARALAR
jgi:hypothetical protein